jgi:hypothetical protein
MPVLDPDWSTPPRTPSFATTHPVLDHTAYPHIFERIAAHCGHTALLILRATSKSWQIQVDRILVRHVRISEACLLGGRVREVKALLPNPGDQHGDLPTYRLPFMRNSDYSKWQALAPYTKAVRLTSTPRSGRGGVRMVLESLPNLSTLHSYVRGTAMTPDDLRALPACDVYVAIWDVPNFSARSPLRPGGRIVIPHPLSWSYWWDLRVGALEVVFVFHPSEINWSYLKAPLSPEDVSNPLGGVIRRFFSNLGRVLGSITGLTMPQITLVNLIESDWRLVSPGGLQALARAAMDESARESSSTTDARMACLRFQTLEEYCSRVGEDQVRLELGPRLSRTMGL